MKTIYLVRHGQASWQGDDYDLLTELGEQQAGIVGAALAKRGVDPDLVVSGELRRHRQTADAAVAAAGWGATQATDLRWAEFDYVDIIRAFDPRFTTHADLRTVAGEGTAGNQEFAALFQGSLRGWIADDGTFIERFDQFCSRVVSACDHVIGELDDDQTAVVFTSGGPIGAVANHALGGVPDQWLKLIVSVNAAVSQLIVLPDDTVMLTSLNEHAHLDEAGVVTY